MSKKIFSNLSLELIFSVFSLLRHLNKEGKHQKEENL